MLANVKNNLCCRRPEITSKTLKLFMGAAWHRTKTLAWGPKIVCSNPPGTSVSLCGATVLPVGAVGVYSLLSSALARLVAFMRVWGRCWEAV